MIQQEKLQLQNSCLEMLQKIVQLQKNVKQVKPMNNIVPGEKCTQ